MATIVTRSGKGSPLTHAEVDANFTNLNTDKLELSGDTMTGDLDIQGTLTSDALTVDTNTLYVDSTNNRVGIGTISPDTALEVSTSGSGVTDVLKLTTTSANSVPSILFEADASSVQHDAARLRVGQTDQNNSAMIFEVQGSGSISEAMRIDSSGSVGIGTSSPDLVGSTTSLTLNSSGGNGQLSLMGNGTVYGRIFADNATGDLKMGNPTSNDVMFYTANLERMRIDSSGNVGVGTSSPSSLIHASGAAASGGAVEIRLEDTAASSNSRLMRTGSAYSYAGVGANETWLYHAGAGTINIGPDGAGTVKIVNNGSERMRIDSSGNVLIGGTTVATSSGGLNVEVSSSGSTVSPLTLQNQSTGNGSGVYFTFRGQRNTGAQADYTYIQSVADDTTAGNGSLRFHTSGSGTITERMRIDSSGNVGIGTNSPNAPTAIVANTTTYEGLELITPTGDGSGEFHIGVHQNGSTAGRSIVFKRGGSDGMDTESMRIDSNGNVGVGTSSPSRQLHINNASESNIRLQGGSDYAELRVKDADNAFSFHFGATERMRIDSSGNLLVGTSDNTPAEPGSTGNYGVSIRSGSSSQFSVNGTEAIWLNRDSSDGDIMRFRRSLTGVGSISVTSSATAYNTSSDYRLKENVTDVTDGITRVKQLAPKRFNFIVNPDVTVDGFIAHEAQTVVPEAVTGTHDGMRDEEYEVTPAVLDEDGNEVTPAVMGTRSVPDYQGIDQSKLVPLLTAALQEAIAKIETLETEMTSVKARLNALEA